MFKGELCVKRVSDIFTVASSAMERAPVEELAKVVVVKETFASDPLTHTAPPFQLQRLLALSFPSANMVE